MTTNRSDNPRHIAGVLLIPARATRDSRERGSPVHEYWCGYVAALEQMVRYLGPEQPMDDSVRQFPRKPSPVKRDQGNASGPESSAI